MSPSTIETVPVSILMMATGDDDFVMPELLAGEAVTDPIATSKEEPRDSGVVPEPSLGINFFCFSPFFFMLSFADIFFCFLPS